MLERLVSYLNALPQDAPVLQAHSFSVVPHANPDGGVRNAPWTTEAFSTPGGDLDAELDLVDYLRKAIRELPGDDVEFGFPRSADDDGARPENRAVADFLRRHGPFHLHASFHGMAFAAGPWFLLEHAWADPTVRPGLDPAVGDRTAAMRESLRTLVRAMGYALHDIDRGGEKGFFRIDEGFTSRPDSRAMVAHFEALGDHLTADLFRPSSMEFVGSLGGDPLTLVSEMPLFITPGDLYRRKELIRPTEIADLRAAALAAKDTASADDVRHRAEGLGVYAMPLDHQMRLQLEFLAAGLRVVDTRA